MGFKKADVMQISMSVVFSPYIAFLVLTIGRLGYSLWADVRSLVAGEESRV